MNTDALCSPDVCIFDTVASANPHETGRAEREADLGRYAIVSMVPCWPGEERLPSLRFRVLSEARSVLKSMGYVFDARYGSWSPA